MKQYKCHAPVGHISPLLCLGELVLFTLHGFVAYGVEQ